MRKNGRKPFPVFLLLFMCCFAYAFLMSSNLSVVHGEETNPVSPEDFIAVLDASCQAWNTKLGTIENFSGVARIKFLFRNSTHALDARFWSRDPFYRVDILEGGNALARVIDAKEFAIRYRIVPHLQCYAGAPPLREGSVINQDVDGLEPTVQILPPAQKPQLYSYMGIIGLDLVFTPQALFDKHISGNSAFLREISASSVSPGERMEVFFTNLDRGGGILSARYQSTAMDRPAPGGDNYAFLRANRDLEINLVDEFTLIKSKYQMTQQLSEARGKPVLMTRDIEGIAEYRYERTKFGFIPIFWSHNICVQDEDGGVVQNSAVTVKIDELRFEHIPDEVFTLTGLDIAEGTMIRNEITETYFRYWNDSREEILLRQLLAESMRDTVAHYKNTTLPGTQEQYTRNKGKFFESPLSQLPKR